VARLVASDHDDLLREEVDDRGADQRGQDAAAYLTWLRAPTFGLPDDVVEVAEDDRHAGRLTESPFLVALAGLLVGWHAGYDPDREAPPAPIERLAMSRARYLWRNRRATQHLRPRLVNQGLTVTEQRAFLRRAWGDSYNQIARELYVAEGTVKSLLSRARKRFVNLPAPLHREGVFSLSPPTPVVMSGSRT
jgi:DNA-binding CsgD family transcriptional regulator